MLVDVRLTKLGLLHALKNQRLAERAIKTDNFLDLFMVRSSMELC